MTDSDSSDNNAKKPNAIDRAFGEMADDFSEAAKGSGASLGKSMRAISGAIEIVCTSPMLIPSGYKRIVEKIKPLLDSKLKKIPAEKLIDPKLSIAGPAIEAMRFTIDEDELAEMFANLLASSMNSDTTSLVHPSFVEIIKQLTPHEAVILKYMKDVSSEVPLMTLKEVQKEDNSYWVRVVNLTNLAEKCGIKNLSLVQNYVDNLCRLKLCEIPHNTHIQNNDGYDSIRNNEEVKEVCKEIESKGNIARLEKGMLRLSVFGRTFTKICID